MIEFNITNITSGEQFLVSLDNDRKTEFLIGRAPNADICLNDPYISRFHAKLIVRNGQLFISDQASSSGTRLNDLSLPALILHPLQPGAVIKLGSYLVNLLTSTTATMASESTLVAQIPNLDAGETEKQVKVVDGKRERWKDLEVECVRVVDETHDVKTFYFAASDRQFHYKPGQFVNLKLNIDGKEVLRSYSISSSPSRPDTLEITIKRVPAPSDVPDAPPGLVSNWMHDNVKVGSKILISGPLGKFTCADNPIGKLLLISAGSGITPMMSMSRCIIDRALEYDIVFFHAARSVEDIIYRQELEWMSSRFSNFKLFITITRGNSGLPWFGLRGRLNHEMLQLIVPDFRERAVYVCGPNEFMAAAKALLEKEGYPMDNYHEESFGAPKKQKAPNREIREETPPKKGILEELVSIKPASMPEVMISAPEPVEPRETASTMILFQKTGKTVSCSSDDTILEVAEQEGIKIRSSCRAGTCGTCKKKKLAGEVHLDNYDPEALEPEEIAEGYILTCVAYPRGKVILDA